MIAEKGPKLLDQIAEGSISLLTLEIDVVMSYANPNYLISIRVTEQGPWGYAEFILEKPKLVL